MPGDFLRSWIRCKLGIKKLKTSISNEIFKAMESRETNLFLCESFVGAIYMDPRFSVLLSEYQISVAKKHLIKNMEKNVCLE